MTKFTFRNKLKTDNGIVWGQVSAHFDLTGNPVRSRSGPAAVRGAIIKCHWGASFGKATKCDEPKPEDLPVSRSPLVSETLGRLHLRKTGRRSGDSRANVLV